MKNITNAMAYLYNNNHIGLRDGNISFKPAFKNHFFITPGSVKKNNLIEKDLVKVLFTNELKKTLYLYTYNNYLNLKPSRELSMHSMFHIQKHFYEKDLYILHAHPKNLISYIGLKENYELKNIKNIFPEININIGKNVSVCNAGSTKLALESYNNLNNHDIVGLRNHGSLSIGENLDKLIEDIEILEFYLEIVNRSRK